MDPRERELQLVSAGLLARVMRDVADEVPGFLELSRGRYFLKTIGIDGEDKTGLNLTIVFLQREESYRESFEEEVMAAIASSIESNKLSGKIKTVTVNLSQFKVH